MYLMGENQLRHQDILQSFTVADYPNLKGDDRKKIHKEVTKIAHPDYFDNVKNVVSLKDVASSLGF